jgi:hypothetical protein
MSEHGGKTYRPWESQRYRQQAHSPATKLPEGDLVFFLLDVVPQLDLRRCYASYEKETRGAALRSGHDGVPVAVCLQCRGVFEP